MLPRFTIRTLLVAAALIAAVLSWQDYGWYVLMVGIALAACGRRSQGTYFARGVLFGCVLYQVCIGLEEGNRLSRLVRPWATENLGIIERPRRLQTIGQIAQMSCGLAVGFLALWRYRTEEKRKSQPPTAEELRGDGLDTPAEDR